MRKFAVSISSLLCLLSALPAHAIKLEYKVKTGNNWKHRVTMKGDGSVEAAGMRLDMLMEMVSTTNNKVVKVDAEGTFTSEVEQKTEKMKVTVNGMDTPVPAPQTAEKPVTIVLTKQGVPVSVQGLESNAQLAGFDFSKVMNATPTSYPDKDLQVGESWDASPKLDAFPMRVTGRLMALNKVAGRDLAEVEYRFQITGENFGRMIKQATGMEFDIRGPGMTGSQTVTIDASTGIPGPGKGTLELDFTMRVMGQEIRQAMKMTMTMDVLR